MGLSDCFSVLDCAPGCLPGLRPDLPRSDLSFGFFLYGLSEDGGRDDVEESFASKRSRFFHPRRQRFDLRVPRRQLGRGQLITIRCRLPQPRVPRFQLRYPRLQPPGRVRRGHRRRTGHKPQSIRAGDP